MRHLRDITTIQEKAIYEVPLYQVTTGVGLEDAGTTQIHFVKGNKEDESAFRQVGFTTESLLEVCAQYLRENNTPVSWPAGTHRSPSHQSKMLFSGWVSARRTGRFAAYRGLIRSKYMTFGSAIEAAKGGASIRRDGWNGKGMFVFLNMGSVDVGTLPSVKEGGVAPLIEGVRGDLFVAGDTGTVTRLPNLNMRAATGSTVTGWLASQTDILAEDWEIV